ncbi:MAG: hypothetical protein IPP71_10400 [Bacteroidetes bacterium]|nr:hypothetical protein [Bacteroidota bacterium]
MIDGIKTAFNFKIIPTSESGIPLAGPPFVPFVAMLNPENFSIKEDIQWVKDCAPGAAGSNSTYNLTRPRSFSIDLTIDGTGINTYGVKIPVTAQVALFRAVTTNIQGAIHRPAYLMVQYGTFICTCLLVSSTVTYSMFDSYGLPIRAKISAQFEERTVGALNTILAMLSSPDLTHAVTVKERELLPLLTQKIYKNQHYYLQVARVNRIKNFRKLKGGTTLSFPPVSDK